VKICWSSEVEVLSAFGESNAIAESMGPKQYFCIGLNVLMFYSSLRMVIWI
jgi:hypothetical protein